MSVLVYYVLQSTKVVLFSWLVLWLERITLLCGLWWSYCNHIFSIFCNIQHLTCLIII